MTPDSRPSSGSPGSSGPPAAPPRRPRRWDTLDLRLFLVLWAALVASTMLGYEAFRVTDGGQRAHLADGHLPAMPSLPPMALPGPPRDEAGGPPPAGPEGANGAPPREPLPASRSPRLHGPHGLSLGVDLAVRVLVTMLAAALAARWLSAPLRRLREAAAGLRASMAQTVPGAMPPAPPQLDARRGTVEVRETAEAFNDMARQIQADFAAQRLLLATVSHDLRTPLARLRLRLEPLASDGALSARAIEDVREMDELLEGLLDLFRPPPAAGSAQPSTDALALVQALVDDLPGETPEVPVSGLPGAVACGPMPLRRMVGNLLGNALRHSDEVEVDVAPEQDPATGRRGWRVRIDDRGPGLTPGQLAAAGSPFVTWATPASAGPSAGSGSDRAQAPTTPHASALLHAGLGLGLHITRALAERAGGHLALSARPGGGLRAELWLPAARAATIGG